MKLDGKTVFITGGASGLGEACVRLFVKSGANAIIADVNEKKGKSLEEELSPKTLFVKIDVTSEKSVQSGIDLAIQKFGNLHGVINCAGMGYPQRVLSKSGKVHPLAPFEQVIKVNLIGTFNVLRLCSGAFIKNEPDAETKERGFIVNVASVAAFDGQIGQSAYSASKAGVCGMTLPIARDLGDFGIRICTIAPGIFETPMTHIMPKNMKDGFIAMNQFPKRLGLPEEFAALAKHIAENTFLNGEVIRLDAAVRMTPA